MDTSVSFGLFLFGQVFDPYYDPHPADGFTEIPDSVNWQTTEAIYFYRAGETQGRIGIASQVDLVPEPFRRAYTSGYNDGAHFFKFLNFF